MLEEIIKQKREIIFAVATLIISAILIAASIWSMSFLLVRMNNAMEEAKVNESDILHFNLSDFQKLNLKE